jgi:pyruvate/2-oxoglutarate dehydrogenase complex dihydrolipoamide dehydrogenase (E3) component
MKSIYIIILYLYQNGQVISSEHCYYPKLHQQENILVLGSDTISLENATMFRYDVTTEPCKLEL